MVPHTLATKPPSQFSRLRLLSGEPVRLLSALPYIVPDFQRLIDLRATISCSLSENE